MEELLEILNRINPRVDYAAEDRLMDGRVYDEHNIVDLISAISEAFDVEIGPEYLIPKNFNSAAAMWAMIQRIQADD